ncbi:MAG: hypothetical protein SFU86_11515 [Pirellulaceae bacterium]|nr:hypothetical protein [Pirellulaceae bacterium]
MYNSIVTNLPIGVACSKLRNESLIMNDASLIPLTALKFEANVQERGRVELIVPFAAGARVHIFVVEEPRDTGNDLVLAAQSSLDFWDNRLDDEDWNHA